MDNRDEFNKILCKAFSWPSITTNTGLADVPDDTSGKGLVYLFQTYTAYKGSAPQRREQPL